MVPGRYSAAPSSFTNLTWRKWTDTVRLLVQHWITSAAHDCLNGLLTHVKEKQVHRFYDPPLLPLIGPKAAPSHTDAKEVWMLNCGPEACVMVVLWQGCWTEGPHFPPSLPPSLYLSLSPSCPPSLSLPLPFITVADGCRWIPHNHVRTAPPIPIHLFKHISSDGELHKDKGGRQTTKAHKDCPCKQVFLVPNTT